MHRHSVDYHTAFVTADLRALELRTSADALAKVGDIDLSRTYDDVSCEFAKDADYFAATVRNAFVIED